ncbi:penicillin-binding transpeptidase domain-containing protein [Pseudomonadales bacterium]|nr:penicillin-binding transpeptidase domain-containing protein [Pseudomonadales bacterium]
MTPAFRIHLAAFLFLLLMVGGAGRLIYIEMSEKDFLQDQGDARTIRMERINAHRGMILDRRDNPLAVSSPVVSLWANPSELPEDQQSLIELSTGLGVSVEEFTLKMRRAESRNFVYLRRRAKPSDADAILSLGLPGVYGEKEYHRFYPGGEIAAHVVGFTNIDDVGQEGIELSFDDWLRGKPGKKKVLKNLYGEIVRDIMPVAEAVPGRNLRLSIDQRLQFLAYRELKSAISQYQALSGSFVLLDVQTGEVLAMANQPSYNPNNRIQLDLSSVRNRAVTDVFEPGSTVKPFTVAVALESGLDMGYTIDTSPGFLKVDDAVIKDPRNRGVLDLGGILAYSSQVGISRLALSLNEYDIWKQFQTLGFGEVTGVGFPGESSGFLPNRRRWKDIERVTFAYGYGLTVTPLQLASAYSTIASGGIKREVTLIADQVSEGERVMNARIALQLQSMLGRVITEGTGQKAAIESYDVGGKTGTARKIGENGYDDTRHIAFFAGFAPQHSPRFVGVVLINEPKTEQVGGGSIAAPIFSRVMSNVLRLLSVPPTDTREAV